MYMYNYIFTSNISSVLNNNKFGHSDKF